MWLVCFRCSNQGVSTWFTQLETTTCFPLLLTRMCGCLPSEAPPFLHLQVGETSVEVGCDKRPQRRELWFTYAAQKKYACITVCNPMIAWSQVVVSIICNLHLYLEADRESADDLLFCSYFFLWVETTVAKCQTWGVLKCEWHNPPTKQRFKMWIYYCFLTTSCCHQLWLSSKERRRFEQEIDRINLPKKKSCLDLPVNFNQILQTKKNTPLIGKYSKVLIFVAKWCKIDLPSIDVSHDFVAAATLGQLVTYSE